MTEDTAAMVNLAMYRNKPIKSSSFLVLLLVAAFLAATLTGCGYSNPYVQKSSRGVPAKTIHLSTWQNRTNELGLESVYVRILNSWFKRSERIKVIFSKEQADLKLTGEISSIDLPGLFYDTYDEALEIKIKLTVRFTLVDNHRNRILWQEDRYMVYEPFLLDPKGEQTEYNKQQALYKIGNEIGEHIYLRTHDIANHLE